MEPPEPTGIVGDVNRDGVVNVRDLVFVGSNLGQTGPNDADVNGDGFVDIVDLVKVAGAFGAEAGAPSAWHRDSEIAPTRADVQRWLADARGLDLTDATSKRGVLFLEQLLAALTPKETALLPNYPNPFNPETWIPYRLGNDADVQITIFDTKGGVGAPAGSGASAGGVLRESEPRRVLGWPQCKRRICRKRRLFLSTPGGGLFASAPDGDCQVAPQNWQEKPSFFFKTRFFCNGQADVRHP